MAFSLVNRAAAHTFSFPRWWLRLRVVDYVTIRLADCVRTSRRKNTMKQLTRRGRLRLADLVS